MRTTRRHERGRWGRIGWRVMMGGILLLLGTQRWWSDAHAQVAGTEKRWVRVGSLQTRFSAYGSERAWNNSYYEGLIWPADYPKQDNAVIERQWIACDDFTDARGHHWSKYGIYFAADYVEISLFPIVLKQTAKFEPPKVYVDGIDVTAPYAGDVDEIDPEQIPDRIITNVVNTSMGLTISRRIYVFSQQYHDNYFIREFTLTNTGNVDYDSEIELGATLKGVRFGRGVRYSVCREGAEKIGDGQVWGKHTWVSKRGEDYALHAGERITEQNPIVQWLRCGFAWAGQSAKNAFDNIGAPDVSRDGRLCSPQFAGFVVLHVDRSPTDRSDDPNQPVVLGWHAGDTYPKVGNLQPTDEPNMILLYDMLSGKPYLGLGGNERFYEKYSASNPDPVTVHNDGGGTNIWVCYGPWDLEPGESVTIVEAEAVAGLNRRLCEEIGRRWKQAYDNPSDKGPFPLPNGSTTDNKDVYKNAWVYTGIDSILQTFGRAKRNFDLGYRIPQPPLPPPVFEVQSGGDRIILRWEPSPSESDPDFVGYRIFRSVAKPDTFYEEIASVPKGVTQFEDMSPVRGYSYYYYIVAYNDGRNNTTGDANPPGPLHSGRFYTRTTEPAFLRRAAGRSLDQIRVVPNPYHIAARDLQYPGEPDKIMFLDIPPRCTIKIFTERGDLIETIEHTDGSGDEEWNSVTSSRQVVVSGVYIAVFETPTGERAYRKFVIIR
ncbi:MAG: fibronectin [candidate division KSB1 bacterium]|nr:fibronectin [candidate division KSB1 bacterium]